MTLSPDEWEELISEAPGGENHGRSRVEGVWHRLDNAAGSAMNEHFEYIVVVPVHGTRDCYVNEKCRCKACRRANAEYRRKTSAKLREVDPKEA